MINAVLQLFRHKNLVVVFTVPYISFIDKNARKLCNMQVNFGSGSVMKDLRMARGNARLIRPSQHDDKIYQPFIRVKTKRGPIVMKYLYFPLVGKRLRDKYEERKTEFAQSIYKDALAELKGEEAAMGQLTYKQLEVWNLYGAEGKTLLQISELKGVSERAISHIKQGIEKRLGRRIHRGKEERAKMEGLA